MSMKAVVTRTTSSEEEKEKFNMAATVSSLKRRCSKTYPGRRIAGLRLTESWRFKRLRPHMTRACQYSLPIMLLVLVRVRHGTLSIWQSSRFQRSRGVLEIVTETLAWFEQGGAARRVTWMRVDGWICNTCS